MNCIVKYLLHTSPRGINSLFFVIRPIGFYNGRKNGITDRYNEIPVLHGSRIHHFGVDEHRIRV
jgi:hypothetical protein